MKTGRTLVEIASEIERQTNSKRDYVADTRALSVTPVPVEAGIGLSVPINGHSETYPLTDHCHRQVAERLKIPAVYYDRLRTEAPALLSDNVNHWLHTQPERRMIRTLDGKARAFLSDRYRPLDNYDLLEAVLPKVAEMECQIVSCEVTETRLYIKAITERITHEVRRDDIVQAGICISNSEVGAGRIKVEPLVFRLVCLNGAIVQDMRVGKTHVGRSAAGEEFDGASEFYRDETRTADDRAFWMKVRDVVTGTLNGETFARVVARWVEATEQKIEGDPVKAVEVTAKRLRLDDGERGGVLRHLIEGGDLTAYGLMNAISRFSQDVESYDRATDLERTATQVLELPKADWAEIAQAN